MSTLKAQAALQKTIIWTKMSKIGRQEWDKACIDASLPSRTLKTPTKTRFALKVVFFQVCISLEFMNLWSHYQSRSHSVHMINNVGFKN